MTRGSSLIARRFTRNLGRLNDRKDGILGVSENQPEVSRGSV
jgi:hypothetical protein